ncbi:hypothetical protein [Parasphingorhabdus sp.]|uniref:hypothetical protein n=1 Tax=Parasphingorhabdus sp. TaxID=2709688 RepID=UPI003A9044EE
MAKKPTNNRVPAKVEAKKPYPIAGTSIVPTQLFHVPARQPRQEGPWRDEPDKLAWVDPATGLPCLMLRARNGTLSGYVAVSAKHPLFGYDYRAVPADLGVQPHGGLNYSAPCDEETDERVSVCHITGQARERVRQPRGEQERPTFNEEQWWFGFACDKSYDLRPGCYQDHMSAENGQTYRGEDYVFTQCTNLAHQLAAAGGETGSGVPIDTSASTVPPVGLDAGEK